MIRENADDRCEEENEECNEDKVTEFGRLVGGTQRALVGFEGTLAHVSAYEIERYQYKSRQRQHNKKSVRILVH